jgi:hypothetical protein
MKAIGSPADEQPSPRRLRERERLQVWNSLEEPFSASGIEPHLERDCGSICAWAIDLRQRAMRVRRARRPSCKVAACYETQTKQHGNEIIKGASARDYRSHGFHFVKS